MWLTASPHGGPDGQHWPRANSKFRSFCISYPFVSAQIVVSAHPDRWTRVNRQAARFWAIYLHLGELLEADGTGKPHLPNGVVSFILYSRSELFLRMSVSFT
jgi:hypothetical protein